MQTPLIPARRERTIGQDTTTFLGENDGEMISIAEAKLRLPNLSWPDTQHEFVRYFSASVRAANADILFANCSSSGFAVVINGDLLIDGHLNARAGGDGYDSVVVVAGDVWVESAFFCACITLVCGLLEAATVLMCGYGDDGGALWVDAVRAQVFQYDTYFSKPDCAIDAFCIGDVYGVCSFSPERSAEVFVAEVLKWDVLDQHLAASWLNNGKSILVP